MLDTFMKYENKFNVEEIRNPKIWSATKVRKSRNLHIMCDLLHSKVNGFLRTWTKNKINIFFRAITLLNISGDWPLNPILIMKMNLLCVVFVLESTFDKITTSHLCSVIWRLLKKLSHLCQIQKMSKKRLKMEKVKKLNLLKQFLALKFKYLLKGDFQMLSDKKVCRICQTFSQWLKKLKMSHMNFQAKK